MKNTIWAPILVVLFQVALSAQSVAITFDDGPRVSPTPLMSPEARNAAIIAQLSEHGTQAMFFVTTKSGADRPKGLALLKALSDAGQLIANHTVSHPDFNAEGTTLEAFEGEVEGCDQVIRGFPGYRNYLRFPYLREGATIAKRDGMRAWLRGQGYRIGYVSIDSSDWLIDQKLCDKLTRYPEADIAAFRTLYLDHIWEYSQIYDHLSQRIYGRQIPHVLLLHHNLLNALFLGDILNMFQTRGWKLVSPDKAFEDTAYKVEPMILPLNGSVLERTAAALGIPLKPFFLGIHGDKTLGEAAGKI